MDVSRLYTPASTPLCRVIRSPLAVKTAFHSFCSDSIPAPPTSDRMNHCAYLSQASSRNEYTNDTWTNISSRNEYTNDTWTNILSRNEYTSERRTSEGGPLRRTSLSTSKSPLVSMALNKSHAFGYSLCRSSTCLANSLALPRVHPHSGNVHAHSHAHS